MPDPATPPAPPVSPDALLELFCREARERLERALACLEQGPDACDYDQVHQEFDSLHGGARAVDLPWLEHYSRVVAGYARFLRHLRRNGQHAATHALLTEAVAALLDQCGQAPPGAARIWEIPQLPMRELLNDMQAQMRRSDPDTISPCAGLAAVRPLTLLVVDDSATARLLFRLHLPTAAGHAVHEAADAREALAVAREVHPDVVFLDYNMPDRDGVGIAHDLRAAGVADCFVLLTANVQQAVLDQARAAGFAGVLEKPVSREKIDAILGAARPD